MLQDESSGKLIAARDSASHSALPGDYRPRGEEWRPTEPVGSRRHPDRDQGMLRWARHVRGAVWPAGLRGRLTLAIGLVGLVGLLAVGLNALLLGVFLDRYVADSRGTLLSQQVTTVASCCGQRVRRPGAKPGVMAHFVQLALAGSPERRVVLLDEKGSVLYASPQVPAERAAVVALLQRRLRARGTPPSGWQREGDLLLASAPIILLGAHGTHSVGGIVALAERWGLVSAEWQRVLRALLLSGAAALALTMAFGLAAVRFLLRRAGVPVATHSGADPE